MEKFSEKQLKEVVFQDVAAKLCFKPDEFEESSNLKDDLGADSLDMIEIVIASERDLGIVLSDEEVEKIQTVGDLCSLCKQKLMEQERLKSLWL